MSYYRRILRIVVIIFSNEFQTDKKAVFLNVMRHAVLCLVFTNIAKEKNYFFLAQDPDCFSWHICSASTPAKKLILATLQLIQRRKRGERT